MTPQSRVVCHVRKGGRMHTYFYRGAQHIIAVCAENRAQAKAYLRNTTFRYIGKDLPEYTREENCHNVIGAITDEAQAILRERRKTETE